MKSKVMVFRGDWVRLVKSVDLNQNKSNRPVGFVQAFLTIFLGDLWILEILNLLIRHLRMTLLYMLQGLVEGRTYGAISYFRFYLVSIRCQPPVGRLSDKGIFGMRSLLAIDAGQYFH